MKSLSSKRVAVIIALAVAVLFILLLFLLKKLPEVFLVWAIAVGGILFFIVTYIISNYLIDSFIFEKIKPIYKYLFNTNISSKEFKKSSEKKNLVAEVKNGAENWADNRTKEIDQLKQLEKYRREFLGNVSHELKTPIFNIQGYILTLLDGGLDDSAINRLYLQRAEKSINRLINIVEDLESISRLESGELKLEYEDFNIVHLVYDVFEMQEMLAEKYSINLSFGSNYEKPIKVVADKKRIIEVLNNLIMNSIKYGKKNGTTTVSFFDIGDQIAIEVADTGIGIAEKDISRIFERFYRTDKSRSRDQGGTGLGLSIVKHIIEAHGQTISVRSKPGEGSTFTFTLNKARK
jgi:two-component system, OmpR family, phosphate regulon sensor histidine kinase PhoR